MRRYRKGQIFRPPTAAESAASADALEGFRRRASGPQDLAPVGQDIIVKTPAAGIDARVGTTLKSAICNRCIEIDSTSNEKTIVETDEELRIHNAYTADVPGDSYVITSITLHGTRYAELDSSHHWGTLDDDLDTGGTADFTSDSGEAFVDVKAIPVMAANKRIEAGEIAGITLFSDGFWYVTWAPCPIDQP